MRKIVITLAVVLAALLAIGAAGAGVPWQASLSGAAEVPVPGDPDGSGFANLWLNFGEGALCWEVSWENIDAPSAGHVHVAPAGVPGPVVIPLTDPDTGLFVATGCREVDRELLKAIIQNPDGYYVNLHNAIYPGGAIRGQLANPGLTGP